jgi:hypothetical protein
MVMSQLSQPTISLPTHARPRRAVWLAALLALAAGATVVLILALGSDSSVNVAPISAQSSVRSDGGPEESAVAAAIGSHPAVGPDESRVAAAVGRGSSQSSTGPDESRTAASISGR